VEARKTISGLSYIRYTGHGESSGKFLKAKNSHMKFTLTRLVITNFKGIRSMDIKFSDITNISGQNGTGKTTLQDAFLWLLFDKDSTDRKDFEIKTLDENNQPFHRLDHEVTGYFDINGTETFLRKTFREKWTKPRGSKEQVFENHETSFFWNDVPLKKNEYQAKINDLLNETTFKMITNPLYFNQAMKWQDRRGILIQMAGDISNGDIFQSLIERDGPNVYEDLIHAMNKKTPEEYKKEINSKKSKIKDELILLPSRIDEAKRSLPDEMDYDSLLKDAETKEVELQSVEDLLMNQSKAAQEYQATIQQLLKRKTELNKLMLDIEFAEKEKVRGGAQARITEINTKISELNNLKEQHRIASSNYATHEERKDQLLKTRAKLVEEWKSINTEELVFDEHKFSCPTCKRAYDAENIEAKKDELRQNFNKSKSERLEDNKTRGGKIKAEIELAEIKMAEYKEEAGGYQVQIDLLLSSIESLKKTHISLLENEQTSIQAAINANLQYNKDKEEIAAIDKQVNAPQSDNGKAELLARKQSLKTVISELQGKLNTKLQRERIEARIKELEEQEANMSQELATLEGIEYSIEQFTKAKMTMVEERVNGLFSFVRFKLFEQQINGGEAETCVALINGVPFSDANTASKINAGLDIINTLSKHYDAYAPIFIDNRESVIDILPMNCQIINLRAMKGQKKLLIEHAEPMMASI
jgi:DNA repair protein SbcC/Rad50